MPDDRFVIHIDRDRDGVPDETLDSAPPTDSETLQPPYVDLPPRLVNTAERHGLSVPRIDDDGTAGWNAPEPRQRDRSAGFWAFGGAALAVIAVALALAVALARVFERMLANDTVIALLSMLAAILCAVGGFLGLARLTSLLRLRDMEAPATGDDARHVLAVALLDVGYQAQIAAVLEATTDDLPATIDIVARDSGSGVFLRVLDEDDSQLSERAFPDQSTSQAYARDVFGVQSEAWIDFAQYPPDS